MRIVDIDHVVLRVSDLAKSMAFYCDVLGCEEVRRVEELGLYQLRAGAAMIDLVPLDGELGLQGGAGPKAEGRNVDHFCLRIEPFDEAELAAHLRRHGIAFGDVVQRFGAEGNGPSLYINDPDGNVVELKGPATD